MEFSADLIERTKRGCEDQGVDLAITDQFALARLARSILKKAQRSKISNATSA